MSWLWGKNESGVFDYGLLQADMHSHLIPGVDDGSPDLATSLELIQGMQQLGFKKLITTPHIMWDMYKNTSEDLIKRYGSLKAEVEKSGIDVEIRVAAEYFLDDNVKRLLANKEQLLTIGDNMVLVEFSMANEPMDLKEMLFEMQMQDYQPVIAHPERYVYHERNKSFFKELKDAGYFFQLNIMSLAGTYGKSAGELARYFIKNDFYELAGTDLHNYQHLSHLQNHSIATGMKQLIESGKLLNKEL
jgi:tyrosine-protein phosphatase YwqE